MKSRTRLAIGATVSLVVHGLLFGAVPSWDGEGEDVSTGPPPSKSIEVITVDPEMVREILQPEVRPSMPCLVEASAPHAPRELPDWPTIPVARPEEYLEPDLDRTLVLPRMDVVTPRTKPRVELLRPISDTPVVDVAPPPVPEAAPVAQDPTDPPRLEDLTGLVLRQEPLAYPPQALRRGIEGTASIAVEVGPDGRVTSTRVLKSSGNRVLDRAAQRNLMRWRFDPAAVKAANRGQVFRQDVLFQID